MEPLRACAQQAAGLGQEVWFRASPGSVAHVVLDAVGLQQYVMPIGTS